MRAVEVGGLHRDMDALAQRIQKVEERAGMLFASRVTGVYRTTPEGEIVECNETFARILGYTDPAALVGRNARILFPSPGARDVFVDAVRSEGEVAFFEHSLVARDGTNVHVVEHAVGLFEAGELREIYGFVIDATDRRAAEVERDELVAALMQAAEGVAITDASGFILRVNPAWERLTGWTADEAVGRKMSIVRSGEHPPAFYAELWETIAAGRTWSGTIVNRRPNGTHYRVDTTISPLRDASREITGYLAFQKDVTREIELEERLRASQRLEAMGQIAAGVAHDFNNLLAVILTNAELLLMELPPEIDGRELLSEIVDTTRFGRSLTAQLLAFSRKQQLVPQVVDVPKVIRDVELVLRRAVGKKVDLQLELGADLWPVRVDPARLQAVIMNLALNARDAMDGEGRLTITAWNATIDEFYAETHPGVDPGPHLAISVDDTGCGMDEETRRRIFEPFFTTKEPGKGTGLGLSMVYGTAKQSGGSVWVYSEPGAGASFRLLFPAVDAGVAGAGDLEHPESPGRAVRRLRILVVDDDEGILERVAAVLASAGHHAVVAPSAADALARLRETPQPFDLVLTDVVMPEVSGIDLAVQLRSEEGQPPVVFMSGYPAHRLDLPENAIFVQKPFQAEDLLVAVAAVLPPAEA